VRAAVTVVSRSWSLGLDRRFALGRKLQVVTNGCDPEELEETKPHDFGNFAFVCTGNFYPPKRVMSPVMAALRGFKDTVRGKGGECISITMGRKKIPSVKSPSDSLSWKRFIAW